MALLDRAYAANRRHLVFRRGIATSLASESWAGVRRGTSIFLDRSLVAHNCHGPRLVCSPILYGDLCRIVGVLLRIAPAERKKEGIERDKMGSDAGPGSQCSSSAAIAMDKIGKQLGACVSSRCGMGDAGMVARLGFLGLGLEWPGGGATWQLATDSNRRGHWCCWLIVYGCVCQRDLSYNCAPLDS